MTSGTTLDFPVPGLLAEHVRGERCFVRFGSTFDAQVCRSVTMGMACSAV